MLLAHDSDPFNRWEAGQRLALNRLLAARAPAAAQRAGWTRAFVDAMRSVLRHPTLDAAFKELVLTLPSETYIAEQLDAGRPAAHARGARGDAARSSRSALRDDWAWAFEANQVDGRLLARPGVVGRPRAGQPGAARCCASTARARGDAVWPGRAYQRFKDAGNMTDRFGALGGAGQRRSRAGRAGAASASTRCSRASRWCIDKWFALQATRARARRPASCPGQGSC